MGGVDRDAAPASALIAGFFWVTGSQLAGQARHLSRDAVATHNPLEHHGEGH